MSTSQPTSSSPPAVGSPAPDFDLVADDGTHVRLADLRGKPVVLFFYPKDNTPGCTSEACEFRDRDAPLRAKGAVVLGVSPDSTASHVRFRSNFDLPFRLLSDPDHTAMSAYGVWGEKVLYGRHFLGVIRSTFLIDAQGRIAAVWPKVKVAGHADSVLSALLDLPAH